MQELLRYWLKFMDYTMANDPAYTESDFTFLSFMRWYVFIEKNQLNKKPDHSGD